jgi:uracil-DNA glycosylase
VAPATDDVIAALDALREEVECCSACALGPTRTKAVFGEGDPGADLMFVGEAPGYHEDQQGRPFVGQAGKLLEQLLASIGMTREQVYIANVLKSRPPNNRDPRPEEIDACRPYLFRQVEIIKPKVICTLGNFSTKLLSGDPTGITRVHGRPRAAVIGGHSLYLYPIFHPAAALYTPAMRTTLEEDFKRLPELLAQAAPQPGDEAATPPAAERPAWRPPEHLRRDVAPAAQPRPAAPTLDDAAPALADVAPAFADAAPAVEVVAPVASEAPPARVDPPAFEDAPPVEEAPYVEEAPWDLDELPPAFEDDAPVAAPAPDKPVVASVPGEPVVASAPDEPVVASAPDEPRADPEPAPQTEAAARPDVPAAPPAAPSEPEQLGLF